jgi:hypothetical protein
VNAADRCRAVVGGRPRDVHAAGRCAGSIARSSAVDSGRDEGESAKPRPPSSCSASYVMRSNKGQSALRRCLNLMPGRKSASQPAPTQEKAEGRSDAASPKVTGRLMRGVWRHGYRALNARHGIGSQWGELSGRLLSDDGLLGIGPEQSRSGDLSVATLWLVVWLPHGNPFLECARGRRAAGR